VRALRHPDSDPPKEEFGAWLQMWQTMRENGATVPMAVTAAVTGFQNDPLTVGKAAYTGTATSHGLPSMKSLTKDGLGIAPSPANGAGSASGTDIIPAGWFAISKKSKNVENAVALLKFLASDAEAATTMGMARGVPIPQTMRDRIKSSLTGLDKVVFDNYTLIAGKELAPLQPYPPGAGQLFQTSLTTANQSVGFGKASVSQAAEPVLRRRGTGAQVSPGSCTERAGCTPSARSFGPFPSPLHRGR